MTLFFRNDVSTRGVFEADYFGVFSTLIAHDLLHISSELLRSLFFVSEPCVCSQDSA